MYNSKNVDPAKQKENTFELYSVPVFPTNTPEIIKGEKLSQIKLSLNKEVYIQTMLMARHQTIAKLFEEDLLFVFFKFLYFLVLFKLLNPFLHLCLQQSFVRQIELVSRRIDIGILR